MLEILHDLISPRCQPLFYFLIFILKIKICNFGNNPEIGLTVAIGVLEDKKEGERSVNPKAGPYGLF
jgi:hypothetical protein